MATYARASVSTVVTHTTGSAYTTNTDLQVASGHEYIIKQVSISLDLDTSGTSGTGGFGFLISDSAQANFIYVPNATNVALPLITTAYNANTRARYDFAMPKSDIVTAIPANVPSSSSIYVPDNAQDSMLYNRKLVAGQVLRFSPLDTSGNGWENTGITVNFNMVITYIDYTN